MDIEQAKQIVIEELNRDYQSADDSLVILDALTMVKPYGWVFFFNSRRYMDTGNALFALGGNGPVVFEPEGCKITKLGSAVSPEEEVRRFETGRKDG